MAASRSDMNVLQTDATFVGRVRASMLAASVSITTEAVTTPLHKKRTTQAAAILNAPDSWKQLFAATVATDANVISDATAGGTVALTSADVAAQAALVTDAHIDAAVSAQFNSFFGNYD